MNRRRRDKNKQIICIILFIFVLLSGVFYAVYTTVGKEFLSKENGSNKNPVVIRNETDNKTTVNLNEEPVVDDKPLSNKTTADNKANTNKTQNTTKPKNPNSNTTKPATNTNKEFNGLEVIRDPGNNNNNNSTSNEQAGNNNSSSSGSSTSRPKGTTSTLSVGNPTYGDTTGLRMTKESDTTYTVSGTIAVNDPDSVEEQKKIYIVVYITRPEIYENMKGSYKINGYEEGPIASTKTTFSFQSEYSEYPDTVTLDWGSGQEITYTIKYNITLVPREQTNPGEES